MENAEFSAVYKCHQGSDQLFITSFTLPVLMIMVTFDFVWAACLRDQTQHYAGELGSKWRKKKSAEEGGQFFWCQSPISCLLLCLTRPQSYSHFIQSFLSTPELHVVTMPRFLCFSSNFSSHVAAGNNSCDHNPCWYADVVLDVHHLSSDHQS